MEYVPDNYDQFIKHDMEQEKRDAKKQQMNKQRQEDRRDKYE